MIMELRQDVLYAGQMASSAVFGIHYPSYIIFINKVTVPYAPSALKTSLCYAYMVSQWPCQTVNASRAGDACMAFSERHDAHKACKQHIALRSVPCTAVARRSHANTMAFDHSAPQAQQFTSA